MEVEFKERWHADIEKDAVSASKKLPVEVIKSARNKLHLLRNAPDERTLKNWQSLHFKKLSGDKKGLYSVRVNKTWRIEFKLDKTCVPAKITIISIKDDH
jgi:proteic killer suppression protein